MKSIVKIFTLALVVLMIAKTTAQKIQYTRAYDQTGINVFEAPKAETMAYEGFKLHIGGSFRQGYQMLSHENVDTSKAKKLALYALGNGFNLAAANLNFDVQLGDGIRVFLENYMAARHHNEFWVKGGYIQIDRLPMFGNPSWFEKYVRVKIGHMEVNYGDNHFRRSDGGNAVFNPFVENNVMDQFTTEIGGEVYLYPTEGFMLMLGLTNGLIRNNIRDYSLSPVIGTAKADSITAKSPSILLKAAYDKKVNDDLRFRLSASMYNNQSSPSITLYSGDRTGSGYFGVVEAAAWANSTPDFTSGRFNPGYSNSLRAICINPFIKFKGLELFGTYETALGKTVNEKPDSYDGTDRKTTQLAGELVYRFLANEQLFIGARYNSVTSRLNGYTSDVDITRTAIAAGWFPTKNLLLKGEYVTQKYEGFRGTDIRNGAKFNGITIEAIVGF
ncbi:MAG: hypothetical protein IPN29_09010 [Saprospiraceae bacterium]|nr:hypothetical protein [Saprospiraceae bacterium]